MRLPTSLFARISGGFIAMFATVLAIQVFFFARAIELRERSVDSDHARRLALTERTARELSAAFDASPSVDVERFVRSIDGNVIVILRDGRVAGAADSSIDVRGAIARLKEGLRDVPEAWRVGRSAAAPILVRGEVIGVVGSPPPPIWLDLGPRTAIRAIALVLVGTLVSSFLVVGPVRKRLAALRTAASRLGMGDRTARADAAGNDEVSELARAFNRMADDLAARASALETSDRLRRQLIADVSHELTTPLTSVIGLLDTMLMPEVRLTDAQRERNLQVAIREARRLERLIGELLDVARLEAGGGSLTLEWFPIADVFNDIQLRHERALLARGIRLETRVEPGELLVHGDAFRLEQALENLVANAVRHTPDGGSIALAAAAEGEAAILTVSDSGEGIPPEHLPFVFDRFYKAASVDGTASPGSGLGLSIVKAIVTRHGGRVRASSEVGRGTTVSIELPGAQLAAATSALLNRDEALQAGG